jgi:hypothetical protein
MRLAIFAVLLYPALTHADSASDVEHLVRANLDAIVKDDAAAYKKTIVETTQVIGPNGLPNAPFWQWDCEHATCNNSLRVFDSYSVAKMKWTVPKPTIAIDGKLALFEVTAQLKGVMRESGMTVIKTDGTWPVRVAGVAVDDGGWKIVAIHYGLAITDKALMSKDHITRERGDHPIGGETTIGEEVQRWFPGHLGAHASDRVVVASGTAAEEVATDPVAIAKLVKVWDKMQIQILSTQVTMLPGNQAAWVLNYAALPTKAGHYDVTSAMVVVKDGEAWKWRLVTWAPQVTMHEATH